MNNGLDEQYLDLVRDILENGIEKNTRNGKVISVFGRNIKYKFKDGKFPLLTTKKMAWKAMVTELLWFLRGETNIKWLVEHGCNIWNGDAYARYCKSHTSVKDGWEHTIPIAHSMESFIQEIKTNEEFAKQWGGMGPIYGAQWRSWNGEYKLGSGAPEYDQIANLIQTLKTDPDNRRMMVNAWNVGEIDSMVLPPCHYGFQVWTRELSTSEREIYWRNEMGMKDIDFMLFSLNGEKGLHDEYDKQGVPRRKISLMWNQRSVDTPLGLPFNIASYSLLLEIIAKMVNMVPEELIGNLGDCHIYQNQVDGIKEQLTRTPYNLPVLKHNISSDFYRLMSSDLSKINELEHQDFEITKYESHPTIKMPLSN